MVTCRYNMYRHRVFGYYIAAFRISNELDVSANSHGKYVRRI